MPAGGDGEEAGEGGSRQQGASGIVLAFWECPRFWENPFLWGAFSVGLALFHTPFPLTVFGGGGGGGGG